MARIEDRADFGYIRYANCWEDAEILCPAMAAKPGGRILSIASAGDNSLALLASGARVIAADLNLTQLACVEIRQAAIRRLTQPECLEFLGITPRGDRLEIYDTLKTDLTPNSRRFWDYNRPLLAAGLIHGGKFEQYFRLFRKKVLPFIHGRQTVAQLLAPKSKAERRRFYEQHWANWRWRLLFKLFFSRTVMGRLGRDPEFFRYVEVDVAANILARTRYALTELMPHQNPYLEYILTGNFSRCLPYYLKPGVYEQIKGNIDNLTLVHAPIQEAAVRCGENGFDGYNLSDIFEYLDPQTSTEIYRTLLARANAKARFVYWNMLVPRHCPAELADRIVSCEELAGELFRRDRAFFYSAFIVEEVRCG
ncbi:MAG: DUF3419 family protein [Desulfobulbaceae bacterium]|nr:DUF3419 family protein [Desulfobulbaceae bacterium]